jgi:hypothetical protein
LAGELVTQYAMELLKYSFPELRAISQDFRMESAKLDQEVSTRIVTIPGTSDYSTETGYAAENTTTTDVPVKITEHKSCQVSFNANELASTSRRLFDEQSPAMMYAIGKLLVDVVYAQITAANFTDAPVAKAMIDFDRETVIDLGAALTGNGVPKVGRTLLLNSSYYGKLFADSAIVTLAGMQKAEIITEGQLPRVHKFDVIEAENLPNTDNLAGFGCSKSALVLATRVPNDYTQALPGATGGGTVQVITEPNTGFSVMLTQFIDHKLGAAFARVAVMYGAAKGQQKAGRRLVSAAA